MNTVIEQHERSLQKRLEASKMTEYKKIIVCIIGESGTGKSTVAKLFNKLGWDEVQSHTDRPKRTPNESGHTFHTPESFDEIPEDQKIASTIYEHYRYATIHSDISNNCVFVVDENGLKELYKYEDQYEIITIRIYRKNKGDLDKERLARNLKDYQMKPVDFDYIISNNQTLIELHRIVRTLQISIIMRDGKK